MSVNIILFKATLLIYLVATVFYFIDVIGRHERFGRLARWVLVGGFGMHCVTLVSRYIEAGYTPVTNLHESL